MAERKLTGRHVFLGFAAAFAVMGTKCMGTTSVDSQTITHRWPDFVDILTRLCSFNKDKE